jgi:hypothetical protein
MKASGGVDPDSTSPTRGDKKNRKRRDFRLLDIVDSGVCSDKGEREYHLRLFERTFVTAAEYGL